MSRIGKQPIQLVNGATVKISADNVVTVKGPKGELSQLVDKGIKVEEKEGSIEVSTISDLIQHRAMHGLYRSIINNMVKGVTDGFERKLELVGVGYKAVNTGNILDLALGYSHNIIFEIPKELSIATETAKGANPIITLNGIDKQLIGQVAAKIRSLRKPEPYKGKGVKYVGEYIRRKAGKSAGK